MEDSTRELTKIPPPRRTKNTEPAASIIQKSELEEEFPAEEFCAMTLTHPK
jgi:hypothetical protein